MVEEFTTYYDDLPLFRSKVYDDKTYFTKLSHIINRYFETHADYTLSLTDSSFDLWINGYKEITPNRKASIYLKGCIAAFLLDIEIRKNSNYNHSLDSIMIWLWNQYGQNHRGYDLQEIVIR